MLTDEQWKRLQGKMREAFPEAWGFEFERLVPALTLPDPNDRHVLALAIHYEADVIVTLNSKDFPLAVLHPLGLTRLRPPSFVDRLWRTDPDAVLSAAEQHRLSLSKSALSPSEYLDALRERAGLRQLAARLAARGFLDR